MTEMKAAMAAVLVVEKDGVTQPFEAPRPHSIRSVKRCASTNQPQETTMFNARQARPNHHTDDEAEAHRHAYNAAFEKLGLAWHWDAATFTSLGVQGRDGVRAYLETEQSHLLRAYDADFLVEAIETTKAGCYAGMTRSPGQRPAWSAVRIGGTASRLAA